MERVEPLLTNKTALIWLCAYETDKKTNFAHVAFTVFVFATYFCFLSASIAFLWKFITIDFIETLYVLIQILAALPMMKALIIMIVLRQKFRSLFENLTSFYDACKNSSMRPP